MRDNEELFSSLSRIPNDDPFSFRDLVFAKIKAGEFIAASIIEDGIIVAYTVYFLDIDSGYREFVSVATYSLKPDTQLIFKFENTLIHLAKSLKCDSIRMATVRIGLMKTAINNGWYIPEVTLRKDI